jgi:hypothetical protein
VGRVPNFLYIGTSKAGSTWLYDVLNRHPDVYMAPGKGLHFFSTHYERGLDWYGSHFAEAGEERIVGEVSHGYLYDDKACERIAAMDPETKIMVCLREPAERAFSDYLDGVKNSLVEGSFESQLERDPWLVERGRYAKYLAPYLAQFGRDRVHVGVFDELGADPDAFARKLFGFLEIEPVELVATQRQRMMPAGEPRSRFLSQATKRASHAAKALGFRKLRGRVKTSRRVRSLLYRAYGSEQRPTMQPDTRERLRATFREDVHRLDALLDTELRQQWGYP